MKKYRFLLLLTALLMLRGAYAEADGAALRLAQTASGRGAEYVTEISDGWRFGGKDEDAFTARYDDSDWEAVDLPHTWNAQDGADGGSNYARTFYWYRKDLRVDTPLTGKRVYIEFLGVNQQADLYVNGLHAMVSGSELYTHRGGYTAFRYDVTDLLHTGDNVLAVRADNTKTESTAPISGDFNIYGGIYRRVYLVTVDEVHIDLSDFGSSGLYLTTPNIRSLDRPDGLGALNIRANLVNDGSADRTVTVTAHIDGDSAPADIIRQLTVPAGGSVTFDEDTMIPDPHLWRGIDEPGAAENGDVGYRYAVTLTISDGEAVIDSVSDKVGFRYIWVDKETGFYLNGQPYPLHGVNRHQYKDGLGSAMTEADHKADFDLILEMGANSVRLSHYPQADYVYDLCDENGIVVWTEIPLVNAVGTAKGFQDTTKTQLTELIRQQYNRPSICFWGLENEVSNNSRNAYYTVKALLSALDSLVHAEDPTGRYSTQAVNTDKAMDQNDPEQLADDAAGRGWKSDLIGWNIYPGWYSSFPGTFDSVISEKLAQDSRPMAISEYGCGGSEAQHELYPELGKNGLGANNSKWHPEEYQSLLHEEALAAFSRHRELWAVYAWVMFDFDVDARNEGSRIAQNDKGFVTNDRQTKKDAFYLYKANWNTRDPFVHITSSRYTGREDERTYVKVYSNCDSVALSVNGESLGEMTSLGGGVFYLEDARLSLGENAILATGTKNGTACEDACAWVWPVYASTELASDTLAVDNDSRTVTLDRELTAAAFREIVTGAHNASYTLIQKKKEVTDENAAVTTDMTIEVLAENGMNRATYTIIPYVAPYVPEVRITASSNQTGNTPQNLLDGDEATFWCAADKQYPQSILLDLDEIELLDALTIAWSTKNSRYYGYTVELSEDGEHYALAADCTENTSPGAVTSELHGAAARYVRINVLTCSDRSGYAMAHELILKPD